MSSLIYTPSLRSCSSRSARIRRTVIAAAFIAAGATVFAVALTSPAKPVKPAMDTGANGAEALPQQYATVMFKRGPVVNVVKQLGSIRTQLHRNPARSDLHLQLAGLEPFGGGQSMHEYRQAARLRPGDVGLHLWLGYMAYLDDKPMDAMTMYRQALASQPTNVRAHFLLGLALTKVGRPSEAQQEWSTAVSLSASSQDANDRLWGKLSRDHLLR